MNDINYSVTIRPNMTNVRLHILAGAIVDRFWPGLHGKPIHVGVLVKMMEPLMKHSVETKKNVCFVVVRNGLGYKFQTAAKVAGEVN